MDLTADTAEESGHSAKDDTSVWVSMLQHTNHITINETSSTLMSAPGVDSWHQRMYEIPCNRQRNMYAHRIPDHIYTRIIKIGQDSKEADKEGSDSKSAAACWGYAFFAFFISPCYTANWTQPFFLRNHPQEVVMFFFVICYFPSCPRKTCSWTFNACSCYQCYPHVYHTDRCSFIVRVGYLSPVSIF